MSNKPRKRRTPEQARNAVLDVAERRLNDIGLDGLNIVDVAKEAGMSHATLIHHFGNAAEMRSRLVERMTGRLLIDLMSALNQNVETPALLVDLFEKLTKGGHPKLLAWLAVESAQQQRPTGETYALFNQLVGACTARMAEPDTAVARNLILMVAATAIGMGVIGPVLPELLGMDEGALEGFPSWFAENVLPVETVSS